MDDIHDNAVKHGHTVATADLRFSTFHRGVENGRFRKDCGDVELADVNIGEWFFFDRKGGLRCC